MIEIEKEIKIGEYFTLLGWNNRPEDRAYVGSALQLLVVDPPFIRVQTISKYVFNEDIITLDMRDIEIKKIGGAFLASILEGKLKYRNSK